MPLLSSATDKSATWSLWEFWELARGRGRLQQHLELPQGLIPSVWPPWQRCSKESQTAGSAGGKQWTKLSCLKSATVQSQRPKIRLTLRGSRLRRKAGEHWHAPHCDPCSLGVSQSSLIPHPLLWATVSGFWEENVSKSSPCQSESELSFDLEDLCFRFFFFFFSFFLFLCFSFFFFFLCFSLHSEELELLSSSSEVESSSNCFNCCILNIEVWPKNHI